MVPLLAPELGQAQLFAEEVKQDQHSKKKTPSSWHWRLPRSNRPKKSRNKLRGQGFQLVGYIDCVNWISDKQKDVSDMEKDTRDQLAIIAFHRHETVGKIDQLDKRFAIVETHIYKTALRKLTQPVFYILSNIAESQRNVLIPNSAADTEAPIVIINHQGSYHFFLVQARTLVTMATTTLAPVNIDVKVLTFHGC
ncbi:hypothetical protein Vi05172_g5900 [Venturia inaequalis]|nr:hypothetical protein Vi05172_g5900 [Venturia inaequalis]